MESMIVALLGVAVVLLLLCFVVGIVTFLRTKDPKQSRDVVLELRDYIDTKLNQQSESTSTTLDRTHKSLQDLQGKLSDLTNSQNNILEKLQPVTDISRVLSNSQTRGRFGEVILEDILRDTLPDELYEIQAQVTKKGDGRGNVDCLLKLPPPTGDIPLDSKFSTSGYVEMQDPELEQEKRNLARKAFEDSVITRVKEVEKYIVPGETAELALMFVASDAIVLEIASSPKAMSESRKRKVFIVGPSTLMAAIATIRVLYNDQVVAKNAKLIRDTLVKLTDEVGRLETRTDNLVKHFGNMQTDVDQIKTTSKKINTAITGVASARLTTEPAELTEIE
ncbi:MAG: DNA recombination protein RmuC [Gammaproteobacteria bacterium]|nr:DNA recombination protein RmuC [Gammaproteobacteria bacterium]